MASHYVAAAPQTVGTGRTWAESVLHFHAGIGDSVGADDQRRVVVVTKGHIDEVFLSADSACSRMLGTHFSWIQRPLGVGSDAWDGVKNHGGTACVLEV